MPSTKKSKRSKKSKTPAATAPAADARAMSSQVEQAFVGAGSIVTYMGQVVRLVLHIFDRHKEHLVLEHLIKMQEADAEDKKQSNTKSQRVKLRKYICEAVAAIRPKRVGQPHNCFLKIEDEENALSYKTILEYMDTKFNLVEVDRSSAEAYLKLSVLRAR